MLLGNLAKISEDLTRDLLVLTSLLKSSYVRCGDVLPEKFGHKLGSKSRLENSNGNEGRAQRVRVDNECSENRVQSIDAFNLLQSDILSVMISNEAVVAWYSPLAKLDDILETVDNLQATGGIHLGNTTMSAQPRPSHSLPGVHPAFFIDRLGSVLRIMEISLEDVVTAQTQLSAGVGLVAVGVL